MRAHNGHCYLYCDGAFQPYKGIPPEATFGRVKEFLLRLEGLFRPLPGDVKREDDKLLDAISDVMQSHHSYAEFLSRCEDAAIFCLGDKKGKGFGKGRGPMDDDIVDEPSNSLVHWNIITAHALSRVGLQLQRELLDEKLFSYILEWCETPSARRPGCCYADTCVLYDCEDGVTVRHVSMSSANNVYLRIPHPLLDPVLDDIQAVVLRFYKQTFWANLEPFLCCQAAQALAKRGENIDRCFIGEGPGGVGQSLYSSHLAAMYGHNHAFFDPNVWYQDDELRKQIEQFADCMIITGQEAPEGGRKLREDFFQEDHVS